MRLGKNKDDKGASSQEELEQKVDAMMDLHQTDATPEKVIKPIKPIKPVEPVDVSPPEIDIFADTKTAPEVPKDLKKGLSPTIHEKVTPVASEEVAEPEQIEAVRPASDSTAGEKDPLDDPGTDKAVDEITREESDKVLAAEDAAVAKVVSIKKPSFKEKVKAFFSSWWRNKWARWSTILAIVMLFVGSAAWPTSRYFILNSAGVRSSASLKITDQSSGLPLKNVTVTLGTLKTKTNGDGVAAFQQIKLGSQNLDIERVAFAPIHKKITIGWGSNPLPTVSLHAVGAQYIFHLTDYLSGKPIDEAEVVNGEASAFADKKGEVILTLDNPETDTIEATISSKEYRTEKLSFAASTKTVFAVRMVPAQPVVYVSKQSGKYDVYKVDVDGKNKQLLLAGTGSERREMSIATSPDGSQAALVSSRSNKRDESGYLLDTITLINLKSGQSQSIDDAQSIRLIDWAGNKLVYVATYAAPSAGYAQRQRIVAYNTEENARSVLVTSDYFNGIASIDGAIYYVIASSDPVQPPGFAKVRIDGGSKQSILSKQVATVVRTDVTVLALETTEGWYEYKVGDNAAHKVSAPADPYASRQYFIAPGGTKSAWIDNRDGKGVLLLHAQHDEEKVLVTASGLTAPVRWLSKNTILYRVQNGDETADYVKNIDGGDPKKISDVTAASSLSINY